LLIKTKCIKDQKYRIRFKFDLLLITMFAGIVNITKSMRFLWAIFLFCFNVFYIKAQEYNGTNGLLNVPSAETDSAGTFRGAGMFLGERFLPSTFSSGYNTFGYVIGFTAWTWLEMSYAASLLRYEVDGKLGFHNEDRRVNVKIRPLKEGKWWPAFAIGWDDINPRGLKGQNGYFQNLYLVASKHFDINGFEIGAHLAYRYYPSDKNRDRRGVAGGLTFVPRLGESLQGPKSWLQRPRFIVEWDGVGVNVGADVLLWRHLFIQAALIHGQGFTGGLAYHYTIPF